MDDYHYAQEKLWEAIYSLVGDRHITVRLADARDTLLNIRPEKHLPEHLRKKFRMLMADLNKRVIFRSYGSNKINTRHPKAGRMARTILELYTKLRGGISTS